MSRRETRKHQKKNRLLIIIPLILLVIVAAGVYFFWTNHNPQSRIRTQDTSTVQPQSEKSDLPSTTTEASTTTTTQTSDTTESSENPMASSLIDTTNLSANASQVSYEVYYFNNGKVFSSNNSTRMISASVIKVFIMEYIYLQASKNLLNTEESVQGVPISSLVTTMIQQSDNDATNALIDYIGMDTLNQFFAEAGYHDTVLERRMLDYDAMAQGLNNYTSLNDTMNFLKKVYQNQNQAPYAKMLEIMEGQQIATKIRLKLPQNLPIANKTGELDGVENDIGIVLAPDNPFAVVVLANGVRNIAGIRDAIANFALDAYHLE